MHAYNLNVQLLQKTTIFFVILFFSYNAFSKDLEFKNIQKLTNVLSQNRLNYPPNITIIFSQNRLDYPPNI